MTFRLSVVTPERIVYEGDVDIVVARGVDGELGILTDHAPILVALDVGELFLREPDGTEARATVQGGFLDMRDNVCTVLADTAELA